VPEWLLSDGYCNAALDCELFDYDDGDCCVPGTIQDCDGGCTDEASLGDGACDTALACEATSFDDGDCEAGCPDDEVVDCNNQCTMAGWIGDSICDPSLNCEAFELDGGDCCPEGEHMGCDGETCALDSLISNGECDAIFNCEIELWDGEDCAYCGDGTCDPNEHTFNCDEDCDPVPGAWCESPNDYPNLLGPVWGCNEECVQWEAMAAASGNGQCDLFAACDKFDWDGGECCEPPEVMGCNGICVAETWAGDGYCDYALNCEGDGFDGGDCLDQDDMILLINEFDPNQEGTDTHEFVELFSAASTYIILDGGWRIDVINGANGQLKDSWTFEGSPMLESGGMALIGSQPIIDEMPFGVKTLLAPDGFIENSHEAMGIFRWDGPSAQWVLVDAVHWQDVVEGHGEGDPAPGDDPADDVSIGRCPNGVDTDDNASDFHLIPPTPGQLNMCSAGGPPGQ
jgi:hypothetical protein